jgi:sterol desaturase/sphingolipid hydroxylase (fatty acid hydroxylase superfamily)
LLPPATTSIAIFFSTYLGQAVVYFGVVGAVFLLTRRWFADKLVQRRIHTRGRRFDRSQLAHEVRHTLVVLAIGTAQAMIVMVLRDRGLASLSEGLGEWGLVGAGFALFGLIAFNDLWFYAVHRVLHTRWLFKRIHSVHHRSVDVNPLTSYSFHVIEALLITGWVIPVALLVPLPIPVLIAAQVLGLTNNVMSHLGYELLPRWWVRAPLLRWTNTATFHSLHHERYRGNYGLFTRVWDKLFGTELADYELAFDRAHSGWLAGDPPAVYSEQGSA